MLPNDRFKRSKLTHFTLTHLHTKRRRCFTLIELLISMSVFALISVGAGGIIRTVYQSWHVQKTNLDLIQNARWALQRMTQELRQAQVVNLLNVIGGTGTNCQGDIQLVCNGLYALDTNSNGFYYWRDGTVLYRGQGSTLSAAITNKEELAEYLYYDSADATNIKNGVFSKDSDTLYSIYMRVRDQSVLKQGQPLEYQVQGQVRPRNN